MDGEPAMLLPPFTYSCSYTPPRRAPLLKSRRSVKSRPHLVANPATSCTIPSSISPPSNRLCYPFEGGVAAAAVKTQARWHIPTLRKSNGLESTRRNLLSHVDPHLSSFLPSLLFALSLSLSLPPSLSSHLLLERHMQTARNGDCEQVMGRGSRSFEKELPTGSQVRLTKLVSTFCLLKIG
ncbi:hypothetical protein IE53DRAFT_156515 [Violaceomyces palustris]|uniref:Uncharacterized protein n=1 Tax=Violaceomyces palustris TaxID=1673888 RepID=A0ACD0NTU9_9BASI|nr:hypothetical protein IE53DRAFT_156515 [Violaceomyces palustris]